MKDVTRILSEIEHGDPDAADQLLPLVYEELRKLAAAKLVNEKPDQTLQPTALVHEAYLRLVDAKAQKWNSRGHFFAAAAEAMRRILVESARRKATVKHGGEFARVQIRDDDHPAATSLPDDLLALDHALQELEAEHPDLARVVKLKFFAGLTLEQVAEALGRSRASTQRDWSYARAWLFGRLQPQD